MYILGFVHTDVGRCTMLSQPSEWGTRIECCPLGGVSFPHIYIYIYIYMEYIYILQRQAQGTQTINPLSN